VTFVWPESARLELRGIERDAAMRILEALTNYAATGEGDVKALTGESISIVRVRHRSDVYK
jgi:hypothetical protein